MTGISKEIEGYEILPLGSLTSAFSYGLALCFFLNSLRWK